MKAVVWFRRDLRLQNNQALTAARTASELSCVYVLENADEADTGGAAKVWLHHALVHLAKDLAALGQKLLILQDVAALTAFVQEMGADAVFWNRRYDPSGTALDTGVKTTLKALGLRAESFPGHLLFEPWDSCKSDRTPYKVFTPYWNNLKPRLKKHDCSVRRLRALPPPPKKMPQQATPDFLPKTLTWHRPIEDAWDMSEGGAFKLLQEFVPATYDEGRNIPSEKLTSRLSPYLHFGQITPEAVIATLLKKHSWNVCEAFFRELIWRDFTHHVLYHFPHTRTEPLNDKFKDFPWEPDSGLLRAWQRGRTGYPIVDAGMRELWSTGWMHNRVRMVVASFLVKHLQQDWRAGADWFFGTLVDSDLAQNVFNWQWSAGCGADAAPYFRIFNPWLQGKKFDPDAVYIKKWVPEVRGWKADQIHDPKKRPGNSDYPEPVVVHEEARDRALLAYDKVKSKS
jgi:deoxyribodipyrimidine photo-lyase